MRHSQRRRLPTLVLAAALVGGCADDDASPSPATAPPAAENDGGTGDVGEIELPGERVFPEGVAVDPATDDIYVGSTDDGSIFRARVDDERADVFLPPGADGRTTVTGLAVDGNRLLVAGRDTGRIFAYDTDTAELIATFETSTGERTLINDITVAGDAAYVTDSFRPVLWRLDLAADEVAAPQPWIDLADSPIAYGDGFNLNGITSNADGTVLVVVHASTGELFRIDTATSEIASIDLSGETLRGGDGLELEGTTLFAVAGGELVTIELDDELRTGTVTSRDTLDGQAYPTTLALTDDAYVIVNSQLDMTGGDARPTLPFTVSVLPRA